MLEILRNRVRQGTPTIDPPVDRPDAPGLPGRFRGLPVLDGSRCGDDCSSCIEACPTEALDQSGGKLRLDLGRCLFCGACEEACPGGAVRFTRDHRLAAGRGEDLVVVEGEPYRRAAALETRARRLFGRSLRLRHVSAGDAGADQAEVNVLSTIVYDLGRFGIQIVASPRHADGLVVTGPVPRNMRAALERTWAAIPAPKLVIALGADAISGGPWRESSETWGGVNDILPVDLWIPGFPPHPLTILDALLRLLGRLDG